MFFVCIFLYLFSKENVLDVIISISLYHQNSFFFFRAFYNYYLVKKEIYIISGKERFRNL